MEILQLIGNKYARNNIGLLNEYESQIILSNGIHRIMTKSSKALSIQEILRSES